MSCELVSLFGPTTPSHILHGRSYPADPRIRGMCIFRSTRVFPRCFSARSPGFDGRQLVEPSKPGECLHSRTNSGTVLARTIHQATGRNSIPAIQAAIDRRDRTAIETTVASAAWRANDRNRADEFSARFSRDPREASVGHGKIHNNRHCASTRNDHKWSHRGQNSTRLRRGRNDESANGVVRQCSLEPLDVLGFPRSSALMKRTERAAEKIDR